MQAVILAGGFGTRLRPLTYTRAKPLLPVAGRAMMDWALDRLPDEVDEVIVAGQYRIDQIRAHLDQTPRPFDLRVIAEDAPLGSGGAVRHAVPDADGTVMVVNADIVSDMDLGSMVRQHARRGAAVTIAAKRMPDELLPSFGVIDPGADDDLRVQGFVEKPRSPADAPSDRVNAGIYLLEPEVIGMIPGDRLVSLEKEVFPAAIAKGFDAWRHDGLWIDVGDRPRMIQAHRALNGPDPPRPRCTVVRSIVPDDATIGHGAVVQDSVLGRGVEVAPGAHLDRCIVGDGEHVGGRHVEERVWTGAVPEGFPGAQVGNAMTIS